MFCCKGKFWCRTIFAISLETKLQLSKAKKKKICDKGLLFFEDSLHCNVDSCTKHFTAKHKGAQEEKKMTHRSTIAFAILFLVQCAMCAAVCKYKLFTPLVANTMPIQNYSPAVIHIFGQFWCRSFLYGIYHCVCIVV